MSTYKFKYAERYAVWTVHRERCWLCRTPVGLADVQIDHVIPESLEGSPELPGILREMGLPSDFAINSYENWMPAHAACNLRKSDTRFDPTPLIQGELQTARDHAPRAREIEAKKIRTWQIEKAATLIMQANETGDLDGKIKRMLSDALISFHDENRIAEDRGKPFFLTEYLVIAREEHDRFLLRGATGLVGVRPKGEELHSSWNCPRCGPTGWNGARCITCGMLDDGD